ncbi:MAG: sulfite exporter TauE/SafE family protein, partial [Patescibacteria group bacterium]
MSHSKNTLFKFRYRGSRHALDAFCDELRSAGVAEQIDRNEEKSILRVVPSQSVTASHCIAAAARHGLELSEIESAQADSEKTITVPISGMTCSSCEVLIEQKFKALPGVTRVSVSAHSQSARLVCAGPVPSAHALQDALGEGKYRIGRQGAKALQRIRPSFVRLLGVFSLALLVLVVLSKAGVFKVSASVQTGASLGAIFVMGLVAATSSCLATVGGLLISSVAESEKRRVPTLLFMAGRLLSYAVLGGLIGLLGSVLSPSPAVTGFIMSLAALYMVVMGLDMLGVLPAWVKLLVPTLPKGISARLLGRGGNP